jgi:hypothetical protein
MQKVKLCWVENYGCAYLIGAKMTPRQREQSCIGKVAIEQDFDNPGVFVGWEVRMYVSVMWPVNGTLKPVGSSGVKDTFKEAYKAVELKAKDYFKNFGLEVEIEKPTFLKKEPYNLVKNKIPQVLESDS